MTIFNQQEEAMLKFLREEMEYHSYHVKELYKAKAESSSLSLSPQQKTDLIFHQTKVSTYSVVRSELQMIAERHNKA